MVALTETGVRGLFWSFNVSFSHSNASCILCQLYPSVIEGYAWCTTIKCSFFSHYPLLHSTLSLLCRASLKTIPHPIQPNCLNLSHSSVGICCSNRDRILLCQIVVVKCYKVDCYVGKHSSEPKFSFQLKCNVKFM